MNSEIKLIVFDLDGTLVESHENIHKAAVTALSTLGFENQIPLEKFTELIGKHFQDIFKEFNIDIPDLKKFIQVYKDSYFDFIDHSSLYNGVEDLLRYLTFKKIKAALLTTKSQDQADRIIDHFNLREYFDNVSGRNNGIPVKPSAEPLLLICDDLGIGAENVLMVGDTEMDIQCGKNAGAKTCAVTYGYRNLEIIKNEKPDYIINSMSELKKIV